MKIKFNPEIHELIYQDKFKISFWEHDEGMITFYQDEIESEESDFVCVEVSELKKILANIGQ